MREQFRIVYDKAIEDLRPYIEDQRLLEDISMYDTSINPRKFDMMNYEHRSRKRYEMVIHQLTAGDIAKEAKQWLEIGGFFPIFAMTLSRLGFRVSVIENFSYYPRRFIDMYTNISKQYGIEFVNLDLHVPCTDTTLTARFDYASCLGVLEHIPHTPSYLLKNIHSFLKMSGVFFCEVPNIHYWPKVIKFLRGGHIQQPIEVVYESEIPFVGHHREYTLSDLYYVLKRSGFQPFATTCFNYSLDLSRARRYAVLYAPMFLFDRFKETLLVTSSQGDSDRL